MIAAWSIARAYCNKVTWAAWHFRIPARIPITILYGGIHWWMKCSPSPSDFNLFNHTDVRKFHVQWRPTLDHLHTCIQSVYCCSSSNTKLCHSCRQGIGKTFVRTSCGLVMPYDGIHLGQHGLSGGLLPEGTNPLPEPMFTYHQWGPLTSIWLNCTRRQVIIWTNYGFISDAYMRRSALMS